MNAITDLTNPVVDNVRSAVDAIDVPDVIADAADFIATSSVEGGRGVIAAARTTTRVVARHPKMAVGFFVFPVAALVAYFVWKRRSDASSTATVTDLGAAA